MYTREILEKGGLFLEPNRRSSSFYHKVENDKKGWELDNSVVCSWWQ